MTDATYSLRNVVAQLPARLAQYLEAQYHIWDEYLVRERRRLLDERGIIFAEPFIESTPAYRLGSGYDRLSIPQPVMELLLAACNDPSTGIPAVPYRHQSSALECFFSTASGDLVVSTGTGSGKTETFLMPIIGNLALERAVRPASYARPAVRALLLYPMNALVNDQLARLRRLLGSNAVGSNLQRADGRCATFGMYTSRTPYPGPPDAARTRNIVGDWIDSFFLRYSTQREMLLSEGKWPAKDLRAFRATFQTAAGDSELLARQEMQERPPDILVTNYSMLEYMLLRPVDAPLFTHTRTWLDADGANQLVVVLDEAHLYQGAQGTEVALLLRRLVSRLRAGRERVRFILTSASLGEGADAPEVIRRFAAELTGGPTDGRAFTVVQGDLERPAQGRPALPAEAEAFAHLDLDCILNSGHDLPGAHRAITALAASLHHDLTAEAASSVHALKDSAFTMMQSHPLAAELISSVMGEPTPLVALANRLFPQSQDPLRSLDGLLAVCAFARRARDGRVLLPSRAHLVFRGLDGVFACINPQCSQRHNLAIASLLGRLYARPRKQCECGARVYELLTHRDCGAAYLRGYFRGPVADFLWHEPSTGFAGQGQALTEIHLLVEHHRDQVGGGNQVWLHKTTGQLDRVLPASPQAYVELQEPAAAPVMIAGRGVVTFDRRCPVCLGTWRDANRPKIMDLVTKGEEPFAYLIANQVNLQPPTGSVTEATPNAGRKSLLFSDGRQKAARLARDVPRVIEQDAFRQAVLLAAQTLRNLGYEARLSESFIYAAFVAAAAAQHLRFFDGSDAVRLKDAGTTFTRFYSADLARALRDPWQPQAPPAFRVQMLRILGSAHYSLYALGLGYVAPRELSAVAIRRDAGRLGLSDADTNALATVWIQRMLKEFALYAPGFVSRRSRELAAGHPISSVGVRSGFTRDQRRFLQAEIDWAALNTVFQGVLTGPGDSPDAFVLAEDRLMIVPALNETWYRCQACTSLAPVTWRGRCTACGQNRVVAVQAGADEYLRARKAFWRDPVERVLAGTESPRTINVQEHTAQLSYRDLGDLEATTESYERRFRDILLPQEEAIDVLSCTTTMEVGIDIGSLIGVGLRNMPPSRHNYQQRAGRAGRRGSAVSTVVTFAQNNPHDAFLFDNPDALIAGRSALTGLDIENPTLVVRHAFAEMLQEYFESTVIRRRAGDVFAALGDTRSFFSGNAAGSLADLEVWISGDPEAADVLGRIGRWLPAGARLTAATCAEALIRRLRELQPAAQGVLPAGEDQLIEYLFAHGVLPAYAFPRDLVTLQIERLDAAGQVEIIERPQQSANIALSEYAPGRLVVINKLTYRVGAVTASTPAETVDRARALFARPARYLQCPNCLYTATVGSATVSTPCPVCAAAQIEEVTAVQPQVVWPEGRGELDQLDDDQTITDTTVAQLPVPASDRAFESRVAFGHVSTLSHGRQVPLVIMNRGEVSPTGPSGFQICERCGYTVLGGSPFPPRHERQYHIPRRRGMRVSAHCDGQPQPCFLGYEFSTDVLLLRTPLTAPFVHDLANRASFSPLRDALTSMANGLALTSAAELDIDPRELQSGFRLQRTSGGGALADIYLYDSLAGGAGYARLIGIGFGGVFAAMEARLMECTCQGSCTNCLRTYSNRLMHQSLDRHLAVDLAKYCRTGLAPAPLTPDEQRTRGLPLREMMELRGWTLQPSADFAFEAHRGTRVATIGVYPSLLAPSQLGDSWANVVRFSVHEIAKDLPSCLTKLPP